MDVPTSAPTSSLRRKTLIPRGNAPTSNDSQQSISNPSANEADTTSKPKISSRISPITSGRRRIPSRAPITQNNTRAQSPRDTTPLILHGEEINREEIPSIINPEEPSNPEENKSVEEEIIHPASPEKTPHSSPYNQEIIQEKENYNHEQRQEKEEYIHEDKSQLLSDEHQNVIQHSDEPIFPDLDQEIHEEVPTQQPIAPKRESSIPTREQPIPKVQRNAPRKEQTAPKQQAAPKKPKEEKPAVIRRKQVKAQPKKLQPPDFFKMDQSKRIRALSIYKGKFQNLRDSFPQLGIQLIPEDLQPTPENLRNLHEEYDGYMTHILVSDDVGQSMIVLVLVLGGVEFLLTKVLGLPASQYVIKQFKLIGKYRALLYEMGEEKIALSGGTSPPMVRLIYLILLTSISTIGIRLLESTIGSMGASMAEDIVYGILGGGGSDAPSGDPTENMGGFNLNGILKMVGSFMNGGNAGVSGAPQKPAETRGPAYTE